MARARSGSPVQPGDSRRDKDESSVRTFLRGVVEEVGAARSAHLPREVTPEDPRVSRLSHDLYEQWERAMTAWWDQALASPSFLGAMGRGLATQAGARGAYERKVDAQMERLHLPTRKDLVRVTRIATLLEEKVLAQEDRLVELQDALAVARREVVQARIEAAEARIELRDTLAAVQQELAALRAEGRSAPASPSPTVTPPRRPRTGTHSGEA